MQGLGGTVKGGGFRVLGKARVRGVWGAAAPQGLEGKDVGGLGGGSPPRFRGEDAGGSGGRQPPKV